MGDINVEPNDASMKNFCQIYGCKNIAKDETCFKNPINPTCIDLITTNRPKSFKESEVIETGLSDFHKMSLTVMKVFYNDRESFNKKYKDFSKEAFFFVSSFIWGTFNSAVDNILQKYAPIVKHETYFKIL